MNHNADLRLTQDHPPVAARSGRWGLKLFASNVEMAPLVPAVVPAVFAYVELYTPPGSFAVHASVWRNLNVPFVIHGPHAGHGVNLADSDRRADNARRLEDARRFADHLAAPFIIVHGGFAPDGTEREAARSEAYSQAKALGESRLVLENTPVTGLEGQRACAYAPAHVVEALACGAFSAFALDVGHAIYAANEQGLPFVDEVAALTALGPALFHFADGDVTAVRDVHKNFGRGTFPIKRLLDLIPHRTPVTLETPRDMAQGLHDSVQDAMFLNFLECNMSDS